MDPKTLHDRTEEHFTIKTWGDGIRFEPKPRPCGHCEQVVEDQRLTIAKKVYEYRPHFWEIKCNRCSFKMTVKDLTKFKKE